MYKIIPDVSAVTTIPEAALDRLLDRFEDSICYDVWENKMSNEPLTVIDIGLGTLYIKLEDNSVQYKYVPSERLEALVNSTVCGEHRPVVGRAEVALKKKILNVYKELY